MKKFDVICVVFSLVSVGFSEEENLPPPCSSQIYCHGPLLQTVQMSKIHEDSKTFVDMKLRKPANETLQLFDNFMEELHHRPSKLDVKKFVVENFEEAGMEFENWNPNDWTSHPGFVNGIKDEELKSWSLSLNAIWKELGRKLKKEVEFNQELYSIIWVPNPVIVPGGRFREFYYWDSYWIVQGLLLSEMHETARGMLENFLYIVDQYGHIPNGGRIYYLERSQPPVLIPMIKLYYDFTNNLTFVKNSIDLMEKEFTYWLNEHSKTVNIDGTEYTLATYGDQSVGPRPESYSEDVESAFNLDDSKKEAFYSELKAGAESGWDFSSRWFIVNGTNKGNLTNIKTKSILPVDLNSLIFWNAKLLSEFYNILGNKEKSEHYTEIANQWLQAVEAVLWHEEIGSWLDYDTSNNVKRDYFYPTNIAPLWTGCFNQSKKDDIAHAVMKYLQNKNVMYIGGVPATVEHTGEQWDYPNAWPPLQHMMIVGLNNTGVDPAVRMAQQLAEAWIRSNYKAFRETNSMYEKYDATVPGGHGGGGEYELQKGFGWTNGVVMDLLWRYRDTMTVKDVIAPVIEEERRMSVSASTLSSITTALIALLVSLTAGFIGHKYNNYWLWKTNSKVHIEYTKEIKRKMTLSSDTSEGQTYSKG